MTRREVLPSGMHKPWAGSNRYKISELFPFIVTGPPVIHSSSLPFCLRFKVALRAEALIDTLQNSILGAWLTLTQAGSPPACQSTISSPHVHRRCYPASLRKVSLIINEAYHRGDAWGKALRPTNNQHPTPKPILCVATNEQMPMNRHNEILC